MSLTLALFVYFLIWWTMLFTVLPLWVKRHEDEGRGFDAGAPEKPDLRRKLLLNTLISALILAALYVLVETGAVDWYGMFEDAWK